MPTITLPGTPSLSIDINTLTPTQLAERYKSSIALFATRAKDWEGTSWQQEVATYGGTKVKMHIHPDDPQGAIKKSQLKPALELLAASEGLAMTHTVEMYAHHKSQACLGYVLPFGDKRKAILILGRGVTETRQNLVSMAVRDEYGGVDSTTGKEMQIRTAILHEMGHVLHQLKNPSHYFAIGQLTILSGKGVTELTGTGSYATKYQTFFSGPVSTQNMIAVASRMRAIGSKVSEYAGSGTSHPNEVVAETFAGLMMGQEYDDEVMATYATMGGPTVPTTSRSVRPRVRRGAIMLGRARTPSSSSEDGPPPIDIGDNL